MAIAAATTRKRKNGNSHNDVQTRLGALRADLNALQQDIGALVSDVGEAAGEQVNGAMNAAMESASKRSNALKNGALKNLKPVRKSRAHPTSRGLHALDERGRHHRRVAVALDNFANARFI